MSYSIKNNFAKFSCAHNFFSFIVLILGCLSYDEIKKKRNELFDYEQKKQRESVGRVEKIEVRYLGIPKDETMIMNKNISTPFNCAQRKYKLILSYGQNFTSLNRFENLL